MTDVEKRERGILSRADREYLLGSEKYQDRQLKYDRKVAVRQRIQDAMLDFSLLYDYLDDSERVRAFGSQSREDTVPENLQLEWDFAGGFVSEGETIYAAPTPELEQGMIDTVAFLWLAALDAGISPVDLMETGIERGYTRRHPDHIASPEIDLNASPRHSVAHQGSMKMRAGQELSDREVRAMLEEEREDPADIAAYLRGEYEVPDGVEEVPSGVEITDYMDDDQADKDD